MKNRKDNSDKVFWRSLTIAFLVALGLWLTHVMHCLLYAKYLLLIVGCLFFPIGIIHGIGILLGVPWG